MPYTTVRKKLPVSAIDKYHNSGQALIEALGADGGAAGAEETLALKGAGADVKLARMQALGANRLEKALRSAAGAA